MDKMYFIWAWLGGTCNLFALLLWMTTYNMEAAQSSHTWLAFLAFVSHIFSFICLAAFAFLVHDSVDLE